MKEKYGFANRLGVLATMHKKEQVIAPLLLEHLNLTLIVSPGLDTDTFGTFTREIKRPKNQLETARLKATAALNLSGETIAIASEGSFGIDPSLPFVYSNREIVLLLDQTRNLEILGQEISCDTNYRLQRVVNIQEAEAFALEVGFPDHGIIVRVGEAEDNTAETIKGIVTKEALTDAVDYALKKNGMAHLETDMRALYNPTRMKNIAKATLNLINKIKDTCPECDCPGFAVVDSLKGLPCSWCGLPTQMTLKHIKKCSQCGHTQEILFPFGHKKADPGECQYCNP